MNSPLPLDPSLPEPLARREFLRLLGAAGAATLSMGAPRLLAEGEKVVQPAATADACILIWLAGGMAAPASGSVAVKAGPSPASATPATKCTPRTLTRPPPASAPRAPSG